LSIFEANHWTGFGETEKARGLFLEVLAENPMIAGVWKDLGDLYYSGYDTGPAWRCWDLGRRISPGHPLFQEVGELESQMLADHPEYF